MKTVTELEQSILNKVEKRKCVQARSLMSELVVENIDWEELKIKKVLIDLCYHNYIKEVEFQYSDGTNESVFVPKGTSIHIGYKL